MSLQLPLAPPQYDPRNEAQARRNLQAEDQRNLKRNEDIEIGPRAGRLLIVDEVTGQVGRLKLASGVLSVELLP